MDAAQVVHDYFAKLEALVKTFDFTRQGANESMGKDAAHVVAEGIHDRSIQDQGSPEGKWPDNDADYTAWKVDHYNVALIGVRTGQMFDLTSLLGRIDLRPDVVEIHYGTGQPPDRSMASAYISDEDKSITDIEKAWLFTEKKGRFYVLDDTIAGSVRQYFSDELGKFIAELNARR